MRLSVNAVDVAAAHSTRTVGNCLVSPVSTSRVGGPSTTRLVETRARQHGLC